MRKKFDLIIKNGILDFLNKKIKKFLVYFERKKFKNFKTSSKCQVDPMDGYHFLKKGIADSVFGKNFRCFLKPPKYLKIAI